jgi:hypothetical protein
MKINRTGKEHSYSSKEFQIKCHVRKDMKEMKIEILQGNWST